MQMQEIQPPKNAGDSLLLVRNQSVETKKTYCPQLVAARNWISSINSWFFQISFVKSGPPPNVGLPNPAQRRINEISRSWATVDGFENPNKPPR